MSNLTTNVRESVDNKPDARDVGDGVSTAHDISKKNSAHSGLDLATAVKAETSNMKSADLWPSDSGVKVKVRRRNLAAVGQQRTEYDDKASQGRLRSDVDTEKGTLLMLARSRQGQGKTGGSAESSATAIEGSKLVPSLQLSYPKCPNNASPEHLAQL